MDLLDELQTRVLCGDGAMGTLLLDDGIPLETCFEELCVTQPKRIQAVHEQYIWAGARVIETNSFGANAVRLERFGLEGRVAEINRAAAQVASEAAHGKNVYVAGSVGSLGLTGKEALSRGVDRPSLFREQIKGLLEGGADLIFFETFMECEEMEIAFQAGKEVGASLAVCSFACDPEGRISSGMSLADAFARLRALGAPIMGVNCINGSTGVVQLRQRFPAEYLLAAYPSAGLPKDHEGKFVYQLEPESFARSARELVAGGARLVGGCCGTNPKHIAALAGALENIRPARG
jgi:methionine synthase / methylenetetrahydrofolate reductase(NADPH)